MARLLRSLLMGAVAVLVAGCGSASGATVAPPGIPLNATAIHMIDGQNGWAYGPNLLARTADGARAFRNVTPHGMVAHEELDLPYFLDATHALVFGIVWDGPQIKTSVLERTVDGGTTWQATPMRPAVDGDLSFVDAMHGWLVTSAYSADHLNVTDTLWRTVDGGAGWSPIHRSTYRVDVHPSTVPGGCYWDGSISWASPTHGIVGVACPFDSAPSIDVTDDGGFTWTRQLLPALPDRTGIALFSGVGPVRLFAGGRAIAPVTRCAGDDGVSCKPILELYRSGDGGVTWTAGQGYSGGNASLESTDSDHAWTVGCVGEDCSGDSLLATVDGGVRWNVYPLRSEMGPNLHGSRVYSFVSAQLGFVTVSNEFQSQPGYYRTTDGGKTFDAFLPRLVSAV